MSHCSSGGGALGDAAGNLILTIGIIIVVILLIGIWLLTKAVNTIIRAFARYPQSKALWITLALFCCCLGVTVVAFTAQFAQQVQTYVCIGLAISFVVLVITARCVELSLSTTFERERGPLVQEVLHRPWWNMADKSVPVPVAA